MPHYLVTWRGQSVNASSYQALIAFSWRGRRSRLSSHSASWPFDHARVRLVYGNITDWPDTAPGTAAWLFALAEARRASRASDSLSSSVRPPQTPWT